MIFGKSIEGESMSTLLYLFKLSRIDYQKAVGNVPNLVVHNPWPSFRA